MSHSDLRKSESQHQGSLFLPLHPLLKDKSVPVWMFPFMFMIKHVQQIFIETDEEVINIF